MKPTRGLAVALAPVMTSAIAIGMALGLGAAFLAVSGRDPWPVYVTIFGRGLGSEFGITESLVKATPLLLVAAGLLVAIRAGIWNIGIDGQFLVGALVVGYATPAIAGDLPDPLLWLVGGVMGAVGGAIWALPPAILRARYGLNEIITTIMFNYVAISLTGYLVKGPFRDDAVVAPQTRAIPVVYRLPHLPGTDVHIGIVVAVVAVGVVAFGLARTTVGFKIRVLGQSRRAAIHAGFPIGRLALGAMLVSGGLAGVAGANDVLATKGLFQANWYPAYGLTAFALVYLARLRPYLLLPVALFFGVLSLGADLLRSDDVPSYFVPFLEGLMLVCLAAAVRLERLNLGGRVRFPWVGVAMSQDAASRPVGSES